MVPLIRKTTELEYKDYQMSRGVYHRKLVHVFFVIAVLIIVISTVLFYISYAKLTNEQHATLEASIRSQYMMGKTNMAVVTDSLGNLFNDQASANWANADLRSSEYYYYSLKLYQQLSRMTSRLGDLQYEICILDTNPQSMVITRDGTMTPQWFFSNECPLTENQVSSLFNHFSFSSDSLIIPIYSSEGTLEQLIYALKKSNHTRELLFLVEIPAASLFEPQAGQFLFLSHPFSKTILGSGTSPAEANDFLSSLSDAFKPGFFQLQNFSILLEPIEGTSWYIAYGYANPKPSPQTLVWYLIGFMLLICLVILFTFRKLTAKLYEPIGEAVKYSLADSSEKQLDEFALIRENSQKIHTLSSQLQKALQENEVLNKQQYYRTLLEEGTKETSDQPYSVALLESEEETHYPYTTFILEADVRRMKKVLFIPVNTHTNILILTEESQETTIETIQKLLDTLPDEQVIHCFLSSIAIGKQNLSKAYQQVQKLAEYRHRFAKQQIITQEMVDALQVSTFSYSFSTERKLLYMLLEGDPKGLDLVDEIIAENLQANLNPENRQNFIYSLISTLLRAFQELKQTPQEILGIEFSIDTLYASWRDDAVFGTIRSVVQELTHAREQTMLDSDSQMLAKMQEYIHTNYRYDIMLQDLANKFNITSKYCSCLFKKLSNETFKNYLNNYRIEQASLLIEQNPSIKINDLAFEVGFNSATSFIRVFSKYFGTTPKAYADAIAAEKHTIG